MLQAFRDEFVKISNEGTTYRAPRPGPPMPKHVPVPMPTLKRGGTGTPMAEEWWDAHQKAQQAKASPPVSRTSETGVHAPTHIHGAPEGTGVVPNPHAQPSTPHTINQRVGAPPSAIAHPHVQPGAAGRAEQAAGSVASRAAKGTRAFMGSRGGQLAMAGTAALGTGIALGRHFKNQQQQRQ